MISISNRCLVTLFTSPFKIPKTLFSVAKMSSWTCHHCTFINPPTQKSRCEICLSAHKPFLSSSSTPSKSKWSCAQCTFLNPYHITICEICGGRASASLPSTLEVDDDDFDQAQLDSSVFLPLKGCSNTNKGSSNDNGVIDCDTGFSVELSPSTENCEFGKRGFSAVLRPCSNKRKDRDDDGSGVDVGGSSGFMAVKGSKKAFEVKSLADEQQSGSKFKTWKILSYNIWFREDLEMHNRMRALGNLIQLHAPDVICLQEVTPSFYAIFEKSSWWERYRCSISNEDAIPGAYFCMQLCKLPIKSYSCKPFHNSIMGRQLCVAEVEVQAGMTMVVATSHLESPCPSPPTWDQMFSKERVAQANEAVRFLEKNRNVIFCGDMNWDDKLDGPFPLLDGWVDAWTELKPGEVGWTYDTKSNKMLSGNRSLQKRLDRFVCKLKDMKICEMEMIGRDAIPGVTYVKEKKVKGQVKELELPVLPSDHYGLLLTICPNDSS